MRLLLLLLTSVLFISQPAIASDGEELTPEAQLKSGLTALRSGDKTNAWNLLFPLAQAGDVQSMFYLGEMMLRSPEYGDNLERAFKFFKVAASKGHEGSKAMLPRVKSMIEQKLNTAIPTIAGVSGVPSQQDINDVNMKLAKYKSEVLRFTDNMIETPEIPRIDILVFIEKTDTAAERLYSLTESLQNKFGNKIRTKFFVVIKPENWKADVPPTGGTSLPPSGFTPDFKGSLAAQHGVNKFPSVVVLPPSGQPQVIEDLSSLSSLITNLL